MAISSILFLMGIFSLRPTLQTSLQSNYKNAVTYTAGVVEFKPAHFEHKDWSLLAQLEDNLKGYKDIIISEEARETDIIVFPEMTLNMNEEASFISDPEKFRSTPCDKTMNEYGEKYHDFLIEISCLARNVSKYIVINICEKERCELVSTCSSTGFNIFNTNVVFDRNGTVISRYRKIHLWGEPRNSSLTHSSFGYFDTDFGVRFGHFICFDLLFYMPAQEMVKRMGIRDFIFPTMWFSQLPFLTAIQIQSAWSYANDVNFLAAGASYPPVGTTGTGIYAGKQGAIQTVMSSSEGRRKIYVATLKSKGSIGNRIMQRNAAFEYVPLKKVQQIPSSRLDLYLKPDQLEDYTTIPVLLNDANSLNKTLCESNKSGSMKFCCNFDMKWTEENKKNISNDISAGVRAYSYRLAVFNGLRKEQAPESNMLRNCALIACVGPTISDCGRVFDQSTSHAIVFERLIIEATFPKSSQLLIMPNSLKDDLMPIDVSDFIWQESDDEGTSRNVRFSLKTPVNNLLTFSIYANYYDSIVGNSGTAFSAPITLILLCAVLKIII